MDEPLTYRSAGVDIDEAQRALRAVIPSIQASYNEGVVAGVGGFGGLFRPAFGDMASPVLVASIDGVGTKTRVAGMVGDWSGLGHDIVNHCVNDILCQGAKPLFFLDYYGTSRLHGPVFEQIVTSMADACRAAGMPLLGGETAELPSVYHDDEIDVVGCIVGMVDSESKLPRPKPKPGDCIIGLASVGLHTNGFSLARRALFELANRSVRDSVPGLSTTIGEELLRPHKCYLDSVYPLLAEYPQIYGVAHITGGGLYDNVPRCLSADLKAIIDRRTWTPLPIFQLIQESGGIEDAEMFRTFNMGIGMVLVVDRDAAAGVLQRLNQAGEAAAVIGEVQPGPRDVQLV